MASKPVVIEHEAAIQRYLALHDTVNQARSAGDREAEDAAICAMDSAWLGMTHMQRVEADCEAFKRFKEHIEQESHR